MRNCFTKQFDAIKEKGVFYYNKDFIENINYAHVFKNKLKEMGFHFSTYSSDNETIFGVPMPADNAPGIQVKLMIDEQGDSKIRCYLASDVDSSRQSAVMTVLNSLNERYRFTCLSLDDDGDICASYDFILVGDDEAISEHLTSILFLFTDICDKCIPPIMQTIWKSSEIELITAQKREEKPKLISSEDCDG